jgi:MFS family permease
MDNRAMAGSAWRQTARLEAVALHVERQLHRRGVVDARRFAVRTEARAIVVAILSFSLGLAAGALAFWNRTVPLWEGASVGAAGIAVAASVTLAVAAVSYRLAARDPRQSWLNDGTRSRRAWMTAALAIALAAVFGMLQWMLFRAASLIWPTAAVDTLTATMIIALVAGASGYLAFALAAHVTPTRLVLLLFAVVATGFTVSLATTRDDSWYKLNFSELGGRSGATGAVFNATLIMAGGVTALLAVYLFTSLERWARAEPRVTRPRTLIVYFVFLALAACFIGAAFVPVKVSQVGHNVFAIGMAIIFGALLLGLRFVLPCLSRAMVVLAIAVAAGILFSASLFWVGYYTLTTHEMVCAGLVVGWLLLFTRTLAAGERAASAAAEADAAP